MKLFRRLATIATILMFFSTTAFADSGEWRVVETSGTVRIAQTMAGMQLASTGETLRGGSILSTGLDGRAVLARGEQTIVVGPNSRMSLPAVEDKGMTRILQDLGTLMFKVDKQEKQHFRVETPVIAAVVKGTTFTVTAGADAHAVHVAEGLVEVTSLNNNESIFVAAGETAQVSTADYTFLAPDGGGEGRDKKDAGEDSIEAAPQQDGKRASLLIPTDIGFGPIDYAGLTDGLVRATNRDAFDGAASVSEFKASESAGAAGGVQRVSFDNNGAPGGMAGGEAVVAGRGGDGVDIGFGGAGSGVGVGAGVGGGINVSAGIGDVANVGKGVGAGGIGVGAGVGAGTDVGADLGDVADVGVGVDDGGIHISVGAANGGDGLNLDLEGGPGLGADGLVIDVGAGGKGSGKGADKASKARGPLNL